MSHGLFDQYIEPLLRGERRTCRQLVDGAIQSGMPANAVIKELIWPAMEKVDTLYRADRINTASQHMATRINRFLADQIQACLPKADPKHRRVLVACANDEPEELGGQMVADLFESDGWDVYFVGGGVPHDEILTLVGQIRPDLLLIFGSKPSDAPRCRELVRMIREVNASPTMNVMVSGGVFNRADGLWREVQAEMYAPSATEALRQANEARPRQGNTAPVTAGLAKKRRRRRRAPLLETAAAK